MSGHTPGPWHYRKGMLNLIGCHVLASLACEESIVAAGDFSRERLEANARLIAAAPELLEACKLVHQVFSRSQKSDETFDTAIMGDDEHEAWRKAREAIAKAEGK